MKAGIYAALSQFNSSFEQMEAGLKSLQENGVVTAEFVRDQSTIAEELRAAINCTILSKLIARETEDQDHYGKMRGTIKP
jgi:hypothetical protein